MMANRTSEGQDQVWKFKNNIRELLTGLIEPAKIWPFGAAIRTPLRCSSASQICKKTSLVHLRTLWTNEVKMGLFGLKERL